MSDASQRQADDAADGDAARFMAMRTLRGPTLSPSPERPPASNTQPSAKARRTVASHDRRSAALADIDPDFVLKNSVGQSAHPGIASTGDLSL